MSKAHTSQEALDNFIGYIRFSVDYWAGENIPSGMPCRERLSGLAHSILCLLDGVTDTLPTVELLLRPHPDNKQDAIEDERDWWEDGTEVGDGNMLHEKLHDGWK